MIETKYLRIAMIIVHNIIKPPDTHVMIAMRTSTHKSGIMA